MMKVFLILFVLGIIAGCAGKKAETGLPVISLEASGAAESFPVSKIITDLRVVRLETHPEALLPEYFEVWVGKEYILILGNKEIYMFSPDGYFLRKVAQQGRAPGEFVSLLDYDVDEEKEYLYLADGVGTVDVIDLKKEGIVRKIPVSGGTPNEILVTRDHSLTVFYTLPGSDILCQVDTLLNLQWYTEMKREQDFSGSFYLAEIDGVLRYKQGFGDTLYLQKDSVKTPYCCLVTDRPYSSQIAEGNSIEIAFENKDLFILRQKFTEVERYPGGMSSATVLKGTYWCNKIDYEAKKISDFYIDLFDYSLEFFPFEVHGKTAAWNVSVARYKKIMKDRLDNPALADTLKTLYHELQEDDNPLLLIGEVKEKSNSRL